MIFLLHLMSVVVTIVGHLSCSRARGDTRHWYARYLYTIAAVLEILVKTALWAQRIVNPICRVLQSYSYRMSL